MGVPAEEELPLVGLVRARQDLADCLVVCNLNEQQRRYLLYDENIQDLMELATFKATRIESIERGVKRDGIKWPTVITCNLVHLVYWLQDNMIRDNYWDPRDWTAEMLRYTIHWKENMDRKRGYSLSPKLHNPPPPEKFNPAKWNESIKRFEEYLSRCWEHGWMTLDYVTRGIVGYTRRPRNPSYYDDLKWDMPHVGEAFSLDNEAVWYKLSAWTLGTPGHTWIQEHELFSDGRAAYEDLYKHYMGSGAMNTRCTAAHQTIETLKYKDEHVFPWESYSRQMTEAFQILDDPQNPEWRFTEAMKVKYLAKGVVCNAPEIRGMMWKLKRYTNLQDAINLMAGEIADLFPPDRHANWQN